MFEKDASRVFGLHPLALAPRQKGRFEEDRYPGQAEPKISEGVLGVAERQFSISHGGADHCAEDAEGEDHEQGHPDEKHPLQSGLWRVFTERRKEYRVVDDGVNHAGDHREQGDAGLCGSQ